MAATQHWIFRQAEIMSGLKSEISKQLHEQQGKYTYFLLAAAASCIALAVQRTTGSGLGWKHVPLGLAVLCWAGSFWAGCRNRLFFASTLYATVSLLQLEEGSHPQQPDHPLGVRAAVEGVTNATEKNSTAANRWARWQFRLLIVGALFFLAWHVLEMACTHLPAK